MANICMESMGYCQLKIDHFAALALVKALILAIRKSVAKKSYSKKIRGGAILQRTLDGKMKHLPRPSNVIKKKVGRIMKKICNKKKEETYYVVIES